MDVRTSSEIWTDEIGFGVELPRLSHTKTNVSAGKHPLTTLRDRDCGISMSFLIPSSTPFCAASVATLTAATLIAPTRLCADTALTAAVINHGIQNQRLVPLVLVVDDVRGIRLEHAKVRGTIETSVGYVAAIFRLNFKSFVENYLRKTRV